MSASYDWVPNAELMRAVPNGYITPERVARSHMAFVQELIGSGDHPRVTNSVNRSTKLDKPSMPTATQEPGLEKCEVRLTQADTLTAALEIHQRNPDDRIAVLNMANQNNPGGGFLNGALAQEEDLCGGSTLYPTLHRNFYPIQPEQLIYSPDVMVLKMKDRYIAGGRPLPDVNRFYIDVISSAAISRPLTTSGSHDSNDGIPVQQELYHSEEDRALMERKIRYIINAALNNNVRRLVLGAFGCGVFANPVRQVARMMKDILVGTETGPDHAITPTTDWATHGLVEIVIAIYDKANSAPVWNGFIQEFKEGGRLLLDNGISIPDNMQYTTFPPGYDAAAKTQTATETATA